MPVAAICERFYLPDRHYLRHIFRLMSTGAEPFQRCTIGFGMQKASCCWSSGAYYLHIQAFLGPTCRADHLKTVLGDSFRDKHAIPYASLVTSLTLLPIQILVQCAYEKQVDIAM